MEIIRSLISDSMLYFFMSFLVTAAISPIVISLLYKLHFTVRHVLNKDMKNKEFVKIHGWKSGTPTMGGIMIWLTVPILSWIVLPHSSVLKGFVLGFLIFGLVGFADDLFTMLNKKDNKLREFQNKFLFRIIKLSIMLLISIGFAYFIYSNLFGAATDQIKVIIIFEGIWKYLLLGAVLPVVIYIFDIYDGADGLSSGTLIINTLGMMGMLLLQGKYEFVPVLAMLVGSLLVFLYFNIPPARVWMGAPGAMAIGFGLYYVAIVTKNYIPFFFIIFVQFIDFLSSATQIFFLKFLDRKAFKIAPLHHLFEAIGWPEYKVVMRFWLTSAIFTAIGVWIGIS